MLNKTKACALLLSATLAASMTGCAATDNRALVTIGDEKITYGYAQFAAYYTQALYDILYGDSMSSDMWSTDYYGEGETFQEQVKADLLETLEEQVYLSLHTEDYGVEITEEEEAAIQEAAAKFIEDNTEDGLDQLHATQEYAEQYLRMAAIRNRMITAIEEEADTTVTDEEANQKSFLYVTWNTSLVQDADGNYNVATEDDLAEYRAQAEAILSAEDFETEATNQGLSATSDTFGQSDLEDAAKASGIEEEDTEDAEDTDDAEDEEDDYSGLPYEFLSALDALGEGETTGVVEVDGAIYVGKLVSLTDEDATETARENLIEQKKDDHFEEVLDGYKAENEAKVNDRLWAKVKFIDRFTGTFYETTTDDTEETDTTEETTEDAEEVTEDATEITEETESTEDTEDTTTEE